MPINNETILLKNNFKDHMILKGFSPETQRAYLSSLRGLVGFFPNISLIEMSNEQIQQYILFLIKDKKLQHSSVNVIYAALRLFFHDLLMRDQTKFFLPSRVKYSKLPDILSVEEVFIIINACTNIRDRVMFMLMYDAGLRGSEVVNLKAVNIDSSRMLIKVEQGKGHKDRYVILSKTMLEHLRLYWKTYHPVHWLFPLRFNPEKHIHRRLISQIYQEVKKKTGITKHGGAHTLRHCFATHMLEGGTAIDIVQRLLGHGSLTSTRRYLHLTQQRLDKVKTPIELFGKLSTKTWPHGILTGTCQNAAVVNM
jgi:site-specific recombinase XerD